MKKFSKTLAVILSLTLLFAVVTGCKKDGGGNGETPSGPSVPVIPDTNTVLTESGASDYKIVIKQDASAADRFPRKNCKRT